MSAAALNISGRQLSEYLQTEHFAEIFPSKVASSPGTAIARITETFGVAPSGSGRNIPCIQKLRQELQHCIATISVDRPVGNALMICAPHTHWDPERPIIVSREGSTYRSGPLKLEPGARYIPISFVFTSLGPVAFEWGDETLGIVLEDYEAVWRVVLGVNEAVWKHDWPIGLSLNFRFKDLFSDSLEPTIEYSDDQKNDDDLGRVYTITDLHKEHGEVDFVQVGWHAYADDAYGLSSKANEVLSRTRLKIEQLSLAERVHLERVLREKFAL